MGGVECPLLTGIVILIQIAILVVEWRRK